MESVVKLNRKLGVGGRGVVYEGFDHAKGRFVAVKEIAYMETSMVGEEDTALQEILSELACMREAQHPNLVQYYGARRSAVGVQIIMEYVSGGSLDYVLTRCGPLHEAVARAYTRDVLEALRYLHEVLHVCHRDVKPANILITPDGRCKLADFGVAKRVEETTPTSSPSCGAREGYLRTAVGTPWYMAPEVINGGVDDDDDGDDANVCAGGGTAAAEKAHVQPACVEGSFGDRSNAEQTPCHNADSLASSPPPLYASTSYYNPLKHIIRKGRLGRGSIGYTTRADIWSVGVTVYEMITGTRPFGADLHTPSAVMFHIANCATAPPQLPPELQVSPTLQSFLDLCFVYDKDLRATASELLGHPWLRDSASDAAAAAGRQPPLRRLSDSNACGKDSTSSHAHSSTDRDPSRPPPTPPPASSLSVRQSQQQHPSVFDGVPLLDAMDLPAYPSAAHTVATTQDSSSGSSSKNSAKETGGGAAVVGYQPARSSGTRLSNAGLYPHSFLPPSPASTTVAEASFVSPAEQAEASARYAAARQRIGHTRSSAPCTPAVQPSSGSSSSSGGLQTKYGAFVDVLSHP